MVYVFVQSMTYRSAGKAKNRKDWGGIFKPISCEKAHALIYRRTRKRSNTNPNEKIGISTCGCSIAEPPKREKSTPRQGHDQSLRVSRGDLILRPFPFLHMDIVIFPESTMPTGPKRGEHASFSQNGR